jgi:hypothetical protein
MSTRKQFSALLSACLGVLLLAGFLVATSHTTPQHSTADTIKLAGFGDANSTTKNSTVADRATFAQPGVGEWFQGGKHHPGRDFVGRWKWNGKSSWFCVDFSGHSSDGIHGATVHGMPGYSKSNAKAAFKLGNADEGVLSKVSGLSKASKINAATGWAIWFLSKDKNLHADWKSTYVPLLKNRGEYGAVQKLLAWGHAHGSYSVSVKAPSVQPGQTGHGTVTVKAANGSAAKLLQVRVTGTNVKLSHAGGLTDKKGQWHFKYSPVDFGRSSLHANVTAPSSHTGLLTDASPGRQRLLTGNYHETASGSTHFRTAAAKATAKNVCTTNCDGIATAQWTGIAPKTSAVRIKFHTNAGINARCDARAGKTCTVSKKVPDGTKWVSYEFCILKHGKCVSKYVSVKKNKEFICPPAPVVDIVQTNKVHCPCDGSPTLSGSIEATATSLQSSSRFFQVTLTDVNNGKSNTVNLTNGTPNTFDVPFSNGDEYKVTFKAFDHMGGKLLKSGLLADVTFSTTVH